jgi:YidC/Oxa1 family membrane protein insertase
MDRNTITGMALIMVMLIAYQFLVVPPQEPQKPKTAQTAPKKAEIAPKNTVDSVKKAQMGDFAAIESAVAQDVVLENKDIKVVLSTQGGRVKHVELKGYKSYKDYIAKRNVPLVVFDDKTDNFALELPTTKGKINLADVNFVPSTSAINVTTGQGSVSFVATLASGQTLEQTYSLADKGFLMNYNIKSTGLDGLLTNEPTKVLWSETVKITEKDLNDTRIKSTLNYRSLNDDILFDQISETNQDPEERTLGDSLRWVSFKKKYFLSAIIGKTSPLQGAYLKSVPNMQDTTNLKSLTAQISLSTQAIKTGKANYQLYFGPNKYQDIKGIAEDFGDNVYLGYAFLRPITKFVFVPLFSVLEKNIVNYGILIIIMVLIIKLVLTPLTYKSFLSGAKMRILAPELNEIRKKVGDDKALLQQEQMKLYNQVGVNPLSGCVPVLLSYPILISLFFLFPNLIELRQQTFLWAEDLSTFDSVLKLPFSIPFYGSHVSLFTILMTISSVLFGYYNNQITPDQPDQPFDMKKMAYIMPVIFMFIMNSFPAGLSFYYFVSNVITVLQQIVIRKFVDEDKVKGYLEESRKKIASGTKKQSRFSKMFQDAMKAAEEQKKAQEDEKTKQKKKK